MFLEIRPDMRCVSLSKFFRPRGDPSILLPGYQGIGLRFEEFGKLNLIWPEFMNFINEQQIKVCEFDEPEEHTSCKLVMLEIIFGSYFNLKKKPAWVVTQNFYASWFC